MTNAPYKLAIIYLVSFVFVLGYLFYPQSTRSQTIPVGTPTLEDFYRRQQLTGKVDSTISFLIRPVNGGALSQHTHLHYPDSSRSDVVWEADKESYLQLLPLVWQNQINSTYPYGWNDGPIIPAKGIQTYLSAGLFARYKWFSVQLKPEVVFAQNGNYEGYRGPIGPNKQWYDEIGNRIDMPERFGTGSYSRAFWGQSSVRLTLDPISLGISTENLWWGPGMQNSILMSNTAPGFFHYTLNTSKPVRSYIGSFEGQVILGRLSKSGFPPSLMGDTARHMQYLMEKPEGRRYLSGITLNYQPRWIPGLFIGMSRVYNTNDGMEGSFIEKYLPFLEPFTANSKMGPDSLDENIPRDQMISFFFRYLIPKAKFEFYGEFAKNDHAYDGRDLQLQLHHTRAYTLGLRKLIPLDNSWDGNLQIAAEMTQMAVTNTRRIRSSGSWYIHTQVRDGYTHQGQLLGAGVGPGGNLQTLNLSWVKQLKQLGLQFERFVHNEDFATWVLQDFNRSWVDGSIAAFGSWDYNRFIFNAHIQYMHAYNYQYNEHQDNNNLHIKLGLMYRF